MMTVSRTFVLAVIRSSLGGDAAFVWFRVAYYFKPHFRQTR